MNNTLIYDISIPKEYHSLLVRLRSVYGPNLTINDFLAKGIDEFSTHPGVGKTYITRFELFKEYLCEQLENNCVQLSLLDMEASNNFSIDPRRSALFHKITQCYSHVQTVEEIGMISPSDFASFPGVGKRKVEELISWQQELLPNEQDIKTEQLSEQLKKYRLSYFKISPQEEKILNKVQNSLLQEREITPSETIQLKTTDIEGCQGLGRKTCDGFYAIQQRIINSLNNKDNILVPTDFCSSNTLKEICPIIEEDLFKFSEMLSGNNSIIWKARTGYKTEHLTLQEIGDSLNLTRERIRQVADKLTRRFLLGVRISPNVLGSKIDKITRVQLFDNIKSLRPIFNTDNDLLNMLALISDEDPKDVILRFNPQINRSILDNFFKWNSYPTQRHEILSFLHDEIGGTDEEIDIYFTTLLNSGIIRSNDIGVTPLSLGKENAICHILAGYPKGLKWKEVAIKVNKSNISKVKLSQERPDANLNFSSSVFQSAQHTYSHIKFFPTNRDGIKQILNNVKLALLSSNHDSIHLMAEYYAKLDSPQYDYYTIRHAVRNYGESFNLFFKGKSQSDTVSINPDSKSVSQKEALKRLFLDTDSPLTIQEVMNHIKSHSEGHARLYIDELITSGDIVSVEVNQYQNREVAFKNIEIEQAQEKIKTMITDDDRIHHISVITHHINRMFGYDYSNRFWRSFLLSYAPQMNWYVKGLLVSNEQIGIRGLTELVHEANGMDQESIIAAVQQRVCVSREEIKNAISNYNMKSLKPSSPRFENQGLASDIMEELFLL